MEETVEVIEELVEITGLSSHWFLRLGVFDWIASGALYYGSDDWDAFIHGDERIVNMFSCTWDDASPYIAEEFSETTHRRAVEDIVAQYTAERSTNPDLDFGEWAVACLKEMREEWAGVYEWFLYGEHYAFSTVGPYGYTPYGDDDPEPGWDWSYNEVTFDDLLSPYAKEYINY